MTITTDIQRLVAAGDLDIYVEQVGQGPDVLLIGGLGDTVESWQFQLDGLADRYRLTAFDNRGAGRTAMPEGPATAEAMAEDAAGVLGALDIASAHVAGFSGGSIIAQELALRHPERVRSLVLQSTWPVPDPYLRRWMQFVHWLVEHAPSERAFLEFLERRPPEDFHGREEPPRQPTGELPEPEDRRRRRHAGPPDLRPQQDHERSLAGSAREGWQPQVDRLFRASRRLSVRGWRAVPVHPGGGQGRSPAGRGEAGCKRREAHPDPGVPLRMRGLPTVLRVLRDQPAVGHRERQAPGRAGAERIGDLPRHARLDPFRRRRDLFVN
jgi:pimeloyl-ACP methyl ester carboxylesterase